VSLVHSIAFGSGRAEVFLSLLNGAAVLNFDLKAEGLHRLATWLDEEEITICHLPPMAFHKLAEIYIASKQVPRMRKLRLSGAPITRAEFDLYKRVFPASASLQINMGSTETRRICGAIIDHGFSFPDEGSPVGYAAPWKKIILVDERGDEVAPGEVGEISVRSQYLCDGYWRNSQLTEAKFVHTPDRPGDRLFFTGDMGRFLPDGFLLHLGRKDLMVKIRGYRVEIGEVEKAILRHPRVREAGVAAWDREPDEKYLAAYIALRDSAQLTVDELRKFLRAELPIYMIPTVFMFIDDLPTTNGKIDRRALPQPSDTRPLLTEGFVVARNEVESELVQIWESVLGVHPIGILDNFFDLGGHSLAATRIVSQVMERFQLDVPIQSLFQSPTIAQMAATLQVYQAEVLREGKLKGILDELESLSNEQAEQILNSKNSPLAK
jgi:acyl-coenzyme A synthetase/AMP-(fatty) acid ligase